MPAAALSTDWVARELSPSVPLTGSTLVVSLCMNTTCVLLASNTSIKPKVKAGMFLLNSSIRIAGCSAALILPQHL